VSEAVIELGDVTKRFGAKVALSGLTLNVQRGECFGLIGPNGAGKTTSFALICGYLFPSQGSVKVMGLNPGKPGALKKRVGALPQDAVLPPGQRVGRLLTFWAELSGLESPAREARECLDKVQLGDSWNTQTQALSHGMAKRVSLAQALMGKPPVVLLDEPTAGLDPKVAAQIRQLIREMRGEQTVVVSSHNLQELEELCDAAAILDHGKLVQAGSMSELTRQSAEFRIQVAKGNVPLIDLRALPGCTGATLDPSGSLNVQFDAAQASAEEMVTRTLKLLIERGVLISTVTRGRKLEERVLQLT
jgi:ABC-2 type transport system ATP-binding protein